MSGSTTARAERARSERLDRLALARDARDGRARPPDGGGRRRRRHVEPDDLPEGARGGLLVRRAAARRGAGDRRPDRAVHRARAGRHPRGLRPAARRSGSGPAASTATSRSRSTRRSPTTARRRSTQAMRFHEEVDRKNLYVKIPGTQPGLGAIEDCIAKGRSINVTLIFSLERYAAVVEAYLRGLERLVAAGGDPGLGALRRELLRLPRRHGGRPPARGGRPARTCRDGSRSPTRSSPTSTTARRSRATRWDVPRGQGRTDAALPLGVDVDEEPRLPRRALRRGADRARHREHDAARDGPRLPGPRRGARHAGEGLDEAARAARRARGGRRRLRRRRRRRSRTRACEKFADSFDELLEGITAKLAVVAR